VYQKSGLGPKNGEEYGADFIEEEWADEADHDILGEKYLEEMMKVDFNGDCNRNAKITGAVPPLSSLETSLLRIDDDPEPSLPSFETLHFQIDDAIEIIREPVDNHSFVQEFETKDETIMRTMVLPPSEEILFSDQIQGTVDTPMTKTLESLEQELLRSPDSFLEANNFKEQELFAPSNDFVEANDFNDIFQDSNDLVEEHDFNDIFHDSYDFVEENDFNNIFQDSYYFSDPYMFLSDQFDPNYNGGQLISNGVENQETSVTTDELWGHLNLDQDTSMDHNSVNHAASTPTEVNNTRLVGLEPTELSSGSFMDQLLDSVPSRPAFASENNLISRAFVRVSSFRAVRSVTEIEPDGGGSNRQVRRMVNRSGGFLFTSILVCLAFVVWMLLIATVIKVIKYAI